jgi:hypothetical protein
LGKLSTIIYTFLVFEFFLKLYVWGSAAVARLSRSVNPPWYIILLYSLAFL